jgi:hypothetical protein
LIYNKNIMQKFKIILGALLATISLSLHSQEAKLRVAVFDPSSSGTAIDEGTKVAVREIISSTFVNTGKYNIVERSLLQQVMKEQKFSNTDVVDDSQATELGRLAGAKKVVLSVVTLVGGRNMLSIKVIDVKTATVDQQKTKIVSTNDLLDVVEPLTLDLIGENANARPATSQLATSSEQPIAQSSGAAQVAPYTGWRVEVMTADVPGEHTLESVLRACPQGWRLPTSEELKCICDAKARIGGLKEKIYWSSDMKKNRKGKEQPVARTFNDCKEETLDEDDKCSCRCVRDTK